MCNIKVDEQSNAFTTEFQIGQQLRLMHRQDRLDGLHLDDDRIFDQDVEPVSHIDSESVILHGKKLLGLECQVVSLEFQAQTLAIRAFHQSWAESGMNSIGGGQNPIGNLAVNQIDSVSSVRIRALRGDVFWQQSKIDSGSSVCIRDLRGRDFWDD